MEQSTFNSNFIYNKLSLKIKSFNFTNFRKKVWLLSIRW